MVFVSATVILATLLLWSSLVHAAPQGLQPTASSMNTTTVNTPAVTPAVDTQTQFDIPAAPLGSNPVSAIEAAFENLHTNKVSTSEFSIESVETTRNELSSGRKCAPVIVIFARGTIEPGNVGIDVGPFFFGALIAEMPGKVIVQGVNNYPADVLGYLSGGSGSGAANMADMVKLAAAQCPTSKIVLSGYSQGAQVVHKAAKIISSSLYSKVGAIVLFGDPDNGNPFLGSLNANVKTFCHVGDLICLGWPIPLPAHLTYGFDAPAAAAYLTNILVF